jgi:hypothetical protein
MTAINDLEAEVINSAVLLLILPDCIYDINHIAVFPEF